MMWWIVFPAVIVVCFAVTELSKRMKVPSVVGLILAGLVLGLPAVKTRLIGGQEHTVVLLGDVGLLCLMFLAGLESSWRMLYKERRDAAWIAVFGAVIPLLFGFCALLLLNFSLHTALILGICMSISAEATRAKVLMELKKLKTKVGAALIGAGLIDDMLGLSLFVLITYFIQGGGSREQLLVVGSIIVFFAGIVAQRLFGRHHTALRGLETILSVFLVPFFFVSIGLHFDFGSLAVNPLLLIVVIAVAFAGKFIGVWGTKPFLDFRWHQLNLIGWAMNSRGALELALAFVAFRSGLLSVNLYSSVIVMALVTTLVFPWIITRMVRGDSKIME